MANIFDKIGQAINNIGKNVSNTVNQGRALIAQASKTNPAAAKIFKGFTPVLIAGGRTVSGVTTSLSHPKMLLGDIVNLATLPAQYTAKAVGGGLIAIGNATHDTSLTKAGSSVLRVTRDVDIAAEKNPVASAQIIGGAVLTVVGAVTGGVLSAGGVALMAKGTAAIVEDVVRTENAFQQNANEAQRGGVLGIAGAGTGADSIFSDPAPPAPVTAQPGSKAWEAQQAAIPPLITPSIPTANPTGIKSPWAAFT